VSHCDGYDPGSDPSGADPNHRKRKIERLLNYASRDAANGACRLELRFRSPISGTFRAWSGRFGGSIRSDSTRGWWKTGPPTACATIFALNGANINMHYKTNSCSESWITSACYLCNTHPKTDRQTPSDAVPLLRVQSPSVIVMQRRRGASRGRPVKWFA